MADIAKLSVGREAYYTRELAPVRERIERRSQHWVTLCWEPGRGHP